MKLQVKGFFLSYSFFVIKEETINFPFFCCPFIFEEYINPQVRQNQPNGERSVDSAYFRKARLARRMNRTEHILHHGRG